MWSHKSHLLSIGYVKEIDFSYRTEFMLFWLMRSQSLANQMVKENVICALHLACILNEPAEKD